MNLFKNATKCRQILQVNDNPYIIDEQSDISDSIMKTSNKYKHHPSLLLINSKLSSPESCSLNKIRSSVMEKEIKLLIM